MSLFNCLLQPAYTPQVEAISPTPNEDIRNDLSPFRSTRDELSRNLERLNREISEVETQILKLKKKQVNQCRLFLGEAYHVT